MSAFPDLDFDRPLTGPKAKSNAPAPHSRLAVASLVLGVTGLFLLPLIGPIGPIGGIVTGHMARFKIRHSSGTLDGDGLALSGLILGYIGIALMILGLLVLRYIYAIFEGFQPR